MFPEEISGSASKELESRRHPPSWRRFLPWRNGARGPRSCRELGCLALEMCLVIFAGPALAMVKPLSLSVCRQTTAPTWEKSCWKITPIKGDGPGGAEPAWSCEPMSSLPALGHGAQLPVDSAPSTALPLGAAISTSLPGTCVPSEVPKSPRPAAAHAWPGSPWRRGHGMLCSPFVTNCHCFVLPCMRTRLCHGGGEEEQSGLV